MSIENIVFNDLDTPTEIAIKTVQIFAGSDNLRKELKRLKIEYTKLEKGVNVSYVLRGKEIGRLIVKL
jgi:hypothetical protein